MTKEQRIDDILEFINYSIEDYRFSISKKSMDRLIDDIKRVYNKFFIISEPITFSKFSNSSFEMRTSKSVLRFSNFEFLLSDLIGDKRVRAEWNKADDLFLEFNKLNNIRI